DKSRVPLAEGGVQIPRQHDEEHHHQVGAVAVGVFQQAQQAPLVRQRQRLDPRRRAVGTEQDEAEHARHGQKEGHAHGQLQQPQQPHPVQRQAVQHHGQKEKQKIPPQSRQGVKQRNAVDDRRNEANRRKGEETPLGRVQGKDAPPDGRQGQEQRAKHRQVTEKTERTGDKIEQKKA